MTITDLIIDILKEPVDKCIFEKSAKAEKEICEKLGEDYTQTKYYEYDCHNCDGLKYNCPYSPSFNTIVYEGE